MPNKFQISKFFSLLVSAMAVVLIWHFIFGREGEQVSRNSKEQAAVSSSTTPFIYFSRLDGMGVRDAAEQAPDVVGIMIDNHPDAWPFSGLSRAAVVYEAPVEGGMTRYLALFSKSQQLDKVGPVRSARPYFLDWLAEYGGALYMHCGGSPEALRLIKERGIFDRNEFYWGDYYWRDRGRFAPYNVYTNSDSWQTLGGQRGEDRREEWEGWKFSDLAASTEMKSATGIVIPYLSWHEVRWDYSSSTKKYERLVNNEIHADSDGSQILANNVIVQFVKATALDEIGRLKIDTIGEGEAWVIRNGFVAKAVWKKNALKERTRFFDRQGNGIEFNPGQTWVEVAPVGMRIQIN